MGQTQAFKHRVDPNKLTRKKVAIVGFTDHREQAFLLPRDEFEIWGINELHRQHDPEHFDRWFEIHPRKDIDTDAQHVDAMSKMDLPLYMQDHYADIPASLPFPRDAIVKHFGMDYYTSSIAWETALAIMWGAEEIHIYGVDMAQDSEYLEQRNCCEYWIGIARGRGIKVYVPPTSDLLKTVGQYGFGEEGTEFSLKIKERTDWLHRQDNDFLSNIRALDTQANELRNKLRTEFDQKMAQLENEYRQKREHLLAQRHQVYGAILDCNFWGRSWSMPGAKSRTFSPDRSKDPRTGIAPSGDSDKEKTERTAAALIASDVGVNPSNRITEKVAV